MPTIGSYLLIGAVAAIVTFVVTPLVGMLARRMGWVYLPNDRTVHRRPLPDVGGLAMLVGFVAALGTAWLLTDFETIFSNNSEPLGVFVAVLIIFSVGFIDDVREISAPAKVAGTVLAGLALVWFGLEMFSFRLPYLGIILLSDDLQPLITVLWLLGMTVAVNLIDGLDGLAAGVVAIGAFAFFLYSWELRELQLLDQGNVGPLIAIIAVGVCVGFLPHNFNPARIMMGDGGALLLGCLLAVSTSVVGGRADSFETEFVGTTYFFLAPIAIPLLILGVPILDTLFAIVRRATGRKSLAAADKGHLHHRLMNLGHGHRRSVLILWTWTGLLSAFVLYPTLTGQNPTYLPFGIVAIAIVLFTVLHPSVRRRRREIGRSEESTPTDVGSGHDGVASHRTTTVARRPSAADDEDATDGEDVAPDAADDEDDADREDAGREVVATESDTVAVEAEVVASGSDADAVEAEVVASAPDTGVADAVAVDASGSDTGAAEGEVVASGSDIGAVEAGVADAVAVDADAAPDRDAVRDDADAAADEPATPGATPDVRDTPASRNGAGDDSSEAKLPSVGIDH